MMGIKSLLSMGFLRGSQILRPKPSSTMGQSKTGEGHFQMSHTVKNFWSRVLGAALG